MRFFCPHRTADFGWLRIRSQNQGKCFPNIKNVFPKPFFCFPENIGCFPKKSRCFPDLELFKQVLYHKKNNSKTIFSMATLKAIVKSKTRNGMYNVYIRITQNRQFAYVRTSWMVNDKGLSVRSHPTKMRFWTQTFAGRVANVCV